MDPHSHPYVHPLSVALTDNDLLETGASFETLHDPEAPSNPIFMREAAFRTIYNRNLTRRKWIAALCTRAGTVVSVGDCGFATRSHDAPEPG